MPRDFRGLCGSGIVTESEEGYHRALGTRRSGWSAEAELRERQRLADVRLASEYVQAVTRSVSADRACVLPIDWFLTVSGALLREASVISDAVLHDHPAGFSTRPGDIINDLLP
jgi:hypothetical protein